MVCRCVRSTRSSTAADADAVFLPGGYPELHAPRIAAASRFLDTLRSHAQSRPVYGECGGYMVLGESLTDADGTSHAMAGLLQLATSFENRRLHLGYRRLRLLKDGPLGAAGVDLDQHLGLVVDPVLGPGTAEHV